ncbi:MAG TPA: TonB family protein [Pyrinomonadaceae bacterium]|nr:TonB family protein [Pyrinomonadaceae bacterium]
MYNSLYSHFRLCLIVGLILLASPLQAQDKRSAEKFEELVLSTNIPLFVGGERVYRAKEVTQKAVLTHKPEPDFPEKARKKKTKGIVLMRVVLTAAGEVRVVNILKKLPHGLTEQAVAAAGRIKFNPALIENRPVSQTILLQYHFEIY